ncbi:MAG: muconolactone Delta-isomerase family protein [Actinomycetota bacterium]
MEFLVHIEQDISPDTDPDRLAAVKAAEAVRGKELVEAGKLKRIWRVPGRRAVKVLYEVDSTDELHAILSSMPLFPWMDIKVMPLGTHALDPAN